MMALDIPIEYFEQLIYTGEMAWAKGLKFVEMILSPLNHNIPMDVISKTIMDKYKKRLEKAGKITSLYLSKYYDMKRVSDMDNDSVKAANIIAVLKGEKYVKLRNGLYCKNCSDNYNKYLLKKYGINTSEVEGFIELEGKHMDFINGKLVERDNRYIPHFIIDRAKRYYEERTNKINYKPDDSMIEKNYYENLKLGEERINNIPFKLINISPDNLEKRKIFLTKSYMEVIQSKGDYFVELFKHPALLNYYYDFDTNIEIKRPVDKTDIYNGKNNYYNIELQGIKFKLVEPLYKINYGPKPKRNRKKREKCFNEYFKGSEKEIATNFFETIGKRLDGYLSRGKMISNEEIPDLDISDAKELIDYRKYYITAIRFYNETGREKFKLQADFCYNKMKELSNISPVFEEDRLPEIGKIQ